MENSNMLDLRQYLPPSAVRSAVVTITPEDARRLRDTAHFDRQRNISPANVARLAAEMAKGQFTPGTQIYLCVLPDGSGRIVVGLGSNQVGVDLQQQGKGLTVDFMRSSLPEGLRRLAQLWEEPSCMTN